MPLYEEYPTRYGSDVNRRYRWIRGDWQLAAWLLPRVPGPDGTRLPNPMSLLSRWKLFDNLRRSLVPAALTALLLLAWTLSPNPGFWTLAVLGVVLIPPLLASLLDLLRKPDDRGLGQHLAATAEGAGQRLALIGLGLATLPHEAYYSLDAVLRTLGRLLITHQRLLEWNPSGDQEQRSRTDLSGSFRSMWFAPVLAIATAGALVQTHPAALIAAGPLLLLWLVSPVIAWWISRPLPRREARPDRGADPLPGSHRAQDLGLLRDLRRPRGPLAAAGQPPGGPGGRPGPSHLTRPTWAWRCWGIWPPTTSATSPRAKCWNVPSTPSTPWPPWSATGATSTTGTTPRR